MERVARSANRCILSWSTKWEDRAEVNLRLPMIVIPRPNEYTSIYEYDRILLLECECNEHASDCQYAKAIEERKESVDADGVLIGGGLCINCQVRCKSNLIVCCFGL